MLGSHFDLDKEVARIASERRKNRRDFETSATQARGSRVYSEFDRRIRRFLHTVDDKAAGTDKAPVETTGSTTQASPTAKSTSSQIKKVRGIAESLTQLR